MGFWSLWSYHRKSHQPLSNLFTHSSHMWFVNKHALVRWLWSSVVTSWLSNEIVYYKIYKNNEGCSSSFVKWWTRGHKDQRATYLDRTKPILYFILFYSFVYEVSEVGFYLKVSNYNPRRAMWP